MASETNDGKDGGLLKGKRHEDKNGNSLGGIKAIVTDTNQMVELEGGEVIINREASKKHWKELSRINQSAGGGVPILPPDNAVSDTEEYKKGGRTIEFNPNLLPNKWVYSYAKKIKEKYPKVWALGGNEYGNEAFKNLERAYERGNWTENEEWMYVKWQSFNARHKKDFRIAGVIANLKWLNVVEKGWDYMKNLIEEEIEKRYQKGWKHKMKTGGKFVTGGKLPDLTQVQSDANSFRPDGSRPDDKPTLDVDNNTIEFAFRHLGGWADDMEDGQEDYEDNDQRVWAQGQYEKYKKKFEDWAKGYDWYKYAKLDIQTGEKDWAYFSITIQKAEVKKDSGKTTPPPSKTTPPPKKKAKKVRKPPMFKVGDYFTTKSTGDTLFLIYSTKDIKVHWNDVLKPSTKGNYALSTFFSMIRKGEVEIVKGVPKENEKFEFKVDDWFYEVGFEDEPFVVVSDFGDEIGFGDFGGDSVKSTYKRAVAIKKIEDGLWKATTKPSKTEEKPKETNDFEFVQKTPTGEKSKLNYLQQILVRSKPFKDWFGDWETASKNYIANGKKDFDKDFKNVSKVMDMETLEPRVVYHGTPRPEEFFVFETRATGLNRPYSYFAHNIEYSQNFHTQNSKVLYHCFLNVRTPFRALGKGYEQRRENADYWEDKIIGTIAWDKYAEISKTNKGAISIKKVMSAMGNYLQALAGNNAPFWGIMSFDIIGLFKAFLEHYEYDGMFYSEEWTKGYDEKNPAEFTKAVCVFNPHQIKLADGRNLAFDGNNPDIRYKKGGEVEPPNDHIGRKAKLGNLLFGKKYADGGNLEQHHLQDNRLVETSPPKKQNESTTFVEDLINKMKNN